MAKKKQRPEPVMNRIETLLDERVRPMLGMHGGSISVDRLDANGVLSVKLHGECAGCPAADMSMQYLVRDELMGVIPEIKDITLVGGVSEELLDQARVLLRLKPKNPGFTLCPIATPHQQQA